MQNHPIVVMVCESHNDYTVTKDGKDYILEGIFAELGVENNNGRVYEEKEYLPHIDYLNKRIKKGNLVGELDHPEKFDISLQKVSHIIEEIKYNADKRQVLGRIRLLNTDAGRNAKAMIDDGVKLSISSRAAGVVKEDKKVQIKKIFTYDLVAEPGFESAQLSLMNESLGMSEDSSVRVYEMKDEKYLSTLDFNDNEENTYAFNTELKEKNMTGSNMADEKIKTGFVTVEQMDAYSVLIKEQFEKFNQLLSEKDSTISELSETVAKQKEYLDTIVTTINESFDEVETTQNALVEYSNYLANHTDNLIIQTDSIVERVNEHVEYTEYLSENLDNTITENANIIKFTDYLATTTDQGIQYTEGIAEGLELLKEHNDYVVENLNNLVKHNDYLAETLNNTINYAESFATTLNEGFENGSFNVEGTTKVNESAVIVESKEILPAAKLSEKIDAILESVKKQNTESRDSSKPGIYGISLLAEAKQREFALLEADQKQRVITAVNKQKPMSEQEFISIWESSLNPTTTEQVIENLLNEMPSNLKPIWGKLTEAQQNNILLPAINGFYKLNTPYQIKNFWQTRPALVESVNLSEKFTTEQITGETINESVTAEKAIANSMGYTQDYVSNISKALKIRRF